MQLSIETAIRNAEASLRMEGMKPSIEVLSDCKKVLEGNLSHEQYIAKLKAKYSETQNGNLQS